MHVDMWTAIHRNVCHKGLCNDNLRQDVLLEPGLVRAEIYVSGLSLPENAVVPLRGPWDAFRLCALVTAAHCAAQGYHRAGAYETAFEVLTMHYGSSQFGY